MSQTLVSTGSLLDLRYMKQIKMSLSHIDGWPYKVFNPNWKRGLFLRYEYIVTFWCFCFVSFVVFIYKNIGKLDFFHIGHTYITTFLNMVTTQRIALPASKKYQNLIYDFVQRFHLSHFKDESAYAMKVHKKVDWLCSTVTMLLHIQLYFGIVLFNLTPQFNNFKNGLFGENRINATYEQAVYYQLPFDYTTSLPGFLVVFFANIPISYQLSTAICMYDLLMTLMVIHIWGHLKILKHNISSFVKPLNMMKTDDGYDYTRYSEEESTSVTKELQKIINYHRFIQNFTSSLVEAFTPTLCVYMLFHQVCLCILFLECSILTPEAIGKYGPLTLVLVQQLIQISLIFDLIASLSDTIKFDAYSLPWESMDEKNRKIVLFFLQNTQSPFDLKAFGIVIGGQTMATILKTSVSYYLMLQAFSD